MVVRMHVSMMVGEAVFNGEWDADVFPESDVNQSKFSTSGVSVDQFFLIKLARLLNTDIIVLYVHPDLLSEDLESFSLCVIIKGGPGDTFAPNILIFSHVKAVTGSGCMLALAPAEYLTQHISTCLH